MHPHGPARVVECALLVDSIDAPMHVHMLMRPRPMTCNKRKQVVIVVYHLPGGVENRPHVVTTCGEEIPEMYRLHLPVGVHPIPFTDPRRIVEVRALWIRHQPLSAEQRPVGGLLEANVLRHIFPSYPSHRHDTISRTE